MGGTEFISNSSSSALSKIKETLGVSCPKEMPARVLDGTVVIANLMQSLSAIAVVRMKIGRPSRKEVESRVA